MEFNYIVNEGMKEKITNLKSEHLNQTNVCRLIRGESLTTKEFLPSIFDPNQPNHKEDGDIKNYSCSLFTEVAVKNKMLLPWYKKTFRYVAIGETKKERGISTEPTIKGHIDYYLFDYVNNNPYKDFKI